MERFTEQPKEIKTLEDIEKMSLTDFIKYLRRPEATPSQRGVGDHLDNQLHGLHGTQGVTAGFIQSGINLLLPGINIKRDAAKIILDKMKKN